MATCTRCNLDFTPKRSDAKYCSAACRQAAYAGRPAPETGRVCTACDGPIPDYMRADAMYCCDACRSWINRRVTTYLQTTWQAAFDLMKSDPETFFATWEATGDGGFKDPDSPFVFRVAFE